jgi:hypothetical protein
LLNGQAKPAPAILKNYHEYLVNGHALPSLSVAMNVPENKNVLLAMIASQKRLATQLHQPTS